MEFGWILLGLACWAFGIFVVLVLMQVAGDQQGDARKDERGTTLRSETPVAKSDSNPDTGNRQ